MSESQQIILIPFQGEFLALSVEQLCEARARALTLMPPAATAAHMPPTDQILDAAGMEKATGIPATWFLEQARRNAIPHLRAGKYVRFDLTEALRALRSHRPTVRKAAARGIRLAHSGG